MNKIISTTSALALVAALAGPALAQTETPSDPATGTMSQSAGDGAAETAPAGADDAAYGADSTYLEIPPSVFAASELDLGDITDQSQVEIVTLSGLASGGSDLSALEQDVADNSHALDTLRGIDEPGSAAKRECKNGNGATRRRCKSG